MRAFTLLLLAAMAAGGPATTAAAKSGTVMVCHRTGQKAPAGFFRGHVLTLPESGARAHLGHGDLPVSSAAFKFFVSSKECLVKNGRLYDGGGTPTDETPPPGGEEPGIAPPPSPVTGGSGGGKDKPPPSEEDPG